MTSRQAERKPTVKIQPQFVPEAWCEWQALAGSIKLALKPLLAKRLQSPHVAGSLLHRELAGCNKIKLLKQGCRLVYIVEGDELVVLVPAVGRREDNAAYQAAAKSVK